MAQPDGLGIAAALEVEDAVVAPAVLVVADQDPFRICAEGRLARAAEAEEDSYVAVAADVDAAVHRQHVFSRQAVIHDPEGALLDLAGVLGTADEDLLLGQVDQDDGL